jgi:hypothetical protein
LREALAREGVELHLFSAQRTALGVVSGGMQVVISASNPTPLSPTRLTLTFGRVVTGMATGATLAAPLPTLPNVEASSEAAPTSPLRPSPSAPTGPPVESLESGVAPGPRTAAMSSPVVARPLGRASPTGRFDLTHFYAGLVGAALLIGGAGQMLRNFGERVRWS